jgi:hypothetical protein
VKTHAATIRFWWTLHNLVVHPLLVLWPPVGVWLHTVTADRMEARP